MLSANMASFSIVLGVFVTPFVAICIFFVMMGVSEAREQVRLNGSAVEVEVTILASGVQSQSRATNAPGSGGSNTAYSPQIRYTYELEGTVYEGDRVWSVEEHFPVRPSAAAVAARYPVGAVVTGYADPTNPASSFLEMRWSHMPFVASFAGVSMLALLAAGFIWIVGWRWLGPTILIALASTGLGVGVSSWIGFLWWEQVPAGARPGWALGAIAAADTVCLLPLIALFKARAGARLYRDAQAFSGQQGADE